MDKIVNITLLGVFLTFVNPLIAQVSQVEIRKESKTGYRLYKDGQPYYIKGAGAKSQFGLLAKSGANSIRVWSTNNEAFLDSAQHYDMTVCLGLYVRPERTGMDYNDDYAVKGQIEQLKTEILKYKDHPALLIWGIGNEVDLRYSNFKVWETIEELAQFIKKVDPNHPTMTVIAGVDPSKLYMIKKHCPSIDILGVNVYGSIENAGLNIRRYNWEKPYIVTEWGVNGPFEAKTTSWKAKIEPPNGIKAKQRRRRYEDLIYPDMEKCFGSYCFLWGQKQESTATWHGMFLPNGKPTEAVDVMQYCWTGKWPSSRAPSIQDISIEGKNWQKEHRLAPSTSTTLTIKYEKYDNQDVEINYSLFPEAFTNKIGGDRQESPEEISFQIIKKSDNGITFTSPSKKGAYRIFAYIKNNKEQYSVANLPFLVE